VFRNNRLTSLQTQLLKGFGLVTVLLLSILGVAPLLAPLANATSWGSSVALPGTDPNTNLFPNMLQTSNSSAGHGAIWLVWEKVTTTSSGMIYLMTHNRYGWSGQTALVSDTSDNIAPALGELANGTIILVWSRGTGSLGTYDLFWKGYNGTRWTSISPLVQGNRDNFTPSLTRSSDGTVWLAWSRSNSTNGGGDIFYMTYNGTWSSSRALVFTGAQEKFPNVVQMSDGRVWVSYTSNTAGNDQLWDIIWNGTSWSAPAQLTNTLNPDDYPFLIEDRSGGVWAFWIRQLPTSDPTNPTQEDLFYKNSTNLGATWGPEVQIAVPQFTNSDEFHPTVVQSVDKTLWIVYASNQAITNPYSTYNLYVLQSTPVKGHDLAVTGIKVTPPPAYTSGLVPPNPRQGEMVQVYVTVSNLGDYNETGLTLTASINSGQSLGSATISSLPIGKVFTYVFSWNSTGMPLAYYTVLAAVSPVPGEVTTSGNQLSSRFLLVSPGDANRDGVVNVIDLATIGVRFGLSVGDPLYFPDADLNHDGTINIKDLVICAVNFGVTG
jgi:hypothetical protein